MTYEIELGARGPVVSFPHLPENTHFVDEIDRIPIDQVVIGSCTMDGSRDLLDRR